MSISRKRGKARVTGEHYTHRYLWHAAELLKEKGTADEDGGGVLIMASMLFVYLAFEAYLNDIGPHVCPDEWKDERRFFAKSPYRGALGKLRLLLDRCGIAFSEGKRPYQTIAALDARRDKLVHGRTELIDQEISFKDPRDLKSLDPEVYRFADESFLDRAMADAESLADAIQVAAQAVLGEREVRSARAFRGMIGHQGGSIIEMPG